MESTTQGYHYTATKAVKQYGIAEDPNSSHRPYMEDTNYCADSYNGHPKQALFALFDGHGGKDVSDYCAKNIATLFKQSLKITTCTEAALIDVCQKLDAHATNELKAKLFGSTACIAYIAIE